MGGVSELVLVSICIIIVIYIAFFLTIFVACSVARIAALTFRRLQGTSNHPPNQTIKPTNRILKPPSPLLDLPTELLLTVCDYLERENHVLLSLSCKRLRDLLTSHLDLSLQDLDIRTKFLLLLENDHPEYLTCYICGWMFLWRKGWPIGYGCKHKSHDLFKLAPLVYVCQKHRVSTRREIVDLISRGPQTGLPTLWLNSSGKDRRGIEQITEARWIGGVIMLALFYTYEFQTRVEIMQREDHVSTTVCSHTRYNWRHDTWPILQEFSSGTTRPGEEQQRKCSYCDTDFEISVFCLPAGQVKVQLNVWKNLGSREIQTQGTEQHFRSFPKTALDEAIVSSRHLKALFASGESSAVGAATCQSHIETDIRLHRRR